MSKTKLMSIRELEAKNAQEPYFGKGIQLAGGFDLGAKAPLDSRATVKTIAERDAHVTGNRAYEGMLVYVEAEQKTYQYVNGAWKEFGFNSSDFQAQVINNLESDDTTKALAAAQGKVLKEMIEGVEAKADANTESIERLETEVVAPLGQKVETLEREMETIGDKVADLESAGETATQEIEKVKEDLAQEVLDREAADRELGQRVDTVAGQVTDLTGELAAEVAARKAGDQALQNAIDAEKTRVDEELAKKQDLITPETDLVLNNLTAEGRVVINGDLDVQGTTTTINSENLSVKDRLIEVNSENAPVDEVGIKAYTGGDVAKGLIFKNGKWGVADINDIATFANEEEGTTFKTETVSDFKALATELYVQELISDIDYGAINDAIDAVEEKLTAVEEKIEQVIEPAIEQANRDIEAVGGRVDATEGRLDTVEEKVTELQTVLPRDYATKAELEAHTGNVDIHITKVEKDQIAANKAEIEAARGTEGSLAERFEAIEEQVNEIASVEEVKEVISNPSNTIVLTNAPIEGSVSVMINSLVYVTDFTVEGTTLTWGATEFDIESDDLVVVQYKK